MDATILIADTGTVSVREDLEGQVVLGIGHKHDPNAPPDVELILTPRQLTTLAGELRYLADTYKERVAARKLKNWMADDAAVPR